MLKKLKRLLRKEPLWLQILLFLPEVTIGLFMIPVAVFKTLMIFYREGMKEINKQYEEWKNQQCL